MIKKIWDEITSELGSYALQIAGFVVLGYCYYACCVGKECFWVITGVLVYNVIIISAGKDAMTKWYRRQFKPWFHRIVVFSLLAGLIAIKKYLTHQPPMFEDAMIAFTLAHLGWYK